MNTIAVSKEKPEASAPLNSQTLVLTDDVSIRNLFYLMRRLAARNAAEGSVQAIEAIAERDFYDAVLLDLRCNDEHHDKDIYGITNIQVVLMGRMLTITAEAGSPETTRVVEKYLITGLPGALYWIAGHPQQVAAVGSVV